MMTEDSPEPEEPEPSPDGPIQVDLAWDESVRTRNLPDDAQIELAVRVAAEHEGFSRGQIGVRIASDEAIHEVNTKYLEHDYPTDVISFGYRAESDSVEGELIVSVDHARDQARRLGTSQHAELLLYVVHGTLHICGLDDLRAADRDVMRKAERAVLMRMGIAMDHSPASMETAE